MKRILVAVSVAALVSFTPLSSQAVEVSATPSPTANVSAKPTTSAAPNSSSAPANRARRDAAKKAANDAYNMALTQDRNGRDLAIADAKATLLQLSAAAGKDKVARKAAQDAYKTTVATVITAFKKSVEVDTQVFKDAMTAINKK